MALTQKYQNDTIEWLIWEVDTFDETAIDAFSNMLHCPYLEKNLNSIKTTKRKIEFLGARYLLKVLFGECIELLYNTSGSPYISNSDWNISITHSGKYIAVARSKKRLGIDIEQISEKLERTKHKFSSDKELSFIDQQQNLYQLCLYWSAKESVYKLVSNEALIFDEEMQIEAFTPKNKGTFLLKLNSKLNALDLNIHYRKIENYVFTYCIEA